MENNYNIKVLNVFKKSEELQKSLQHDYIGTEHIILALLALDEQISEKMQMFNLNYENFYDEVKDNLPPCSSKPSKVYTPLLKRIILDLEKKDLLDNNHLFYNIIAEGEGVAIRLLMDMGIDVDKLLLSLNDTDNDLEIYKYGTLLNKTVDLNEKVVSRDKETDLLIQTLLRKKKSNPLLIGPAGVGKTAIVEGLVQKIVLGNVPLKLQDKKIVMLEMGSLVSGTRYRGEFEERLSSIIKELTLNDDIILFIDEIHTMVSAGAAEGAISAGDILKPYLARGQIKCIGATTKEEYEKFITKDKALMRRFETIYVDEPSEKQTFEILRKVKEEYSNFHKVNISDENLKVLITLAGTYFPSKKNPDKSLELLDFVMSFVSMKDHKNIIENKENKLKKLQMQKYLEIENGNFKNALKNNILENKMVKELENIKKCYVSNVSKEDILDVLEFKNNLILHNKNILSLKGKYNEKLLNIINSYLENQNSNITFLFNYYDKKLIDDLAKAIGYEIYNLNINNIDKLYLKVKYNPSLLIVYKDDENYEINKLLTKIRKEGALEYLDDYLSFKNTITILVSEKVNIGFQNNYVSDIPIDEIISLEKTSC